MLMLALNLAIPLVFIALQVAEAIWPARALPKPKWWRVKGFGFFMLSGLIFNLVPANLVPAIFGTTKVLDLSSLGLVAVPLAYLVGNAIGYWWHRARHALTPLWRMHQLHHSAERLDAASALMFHPVESAIQGTLMMTISTVLLGLSVEAGAVLGLFGFAMAVFTHSNIRTPRWLGYIVARPESHGIHHARGVHAFNYCDLPVVDMIFGTFRNPAQHETQHGFFPGSAPSLRMLAFLDGTTPSVVAPAALSEAVGMQRAA